MAFFRARKPRYFCTGCDAGLNERQVRRGLAIKREGDVYCLKCFRTKFPEECEYHPGSKLTALCAVCKRMCCENCVIEIQGKQVCWRCKPRVVKTLKKKGRWPEPLQPRAPRKLAKAEPPTTGRHEVDGVVPFLKRPFPILGMGILSLLFCGVTMLLRIKSHFGALLLFISCSVPAIVTFILYAEGVDRSDENSMLPKIFAGVSLGFAMLAFFYHLFFIIFYGVLVITGESLP